MKNKTVNGIARTVGCSWETANYRLNKLYETKNISRFPSKNGKSFNYFLKLH